MADLMGVDVTKRSWLLSILGCITLLAQSASASSLDDLATYRFGDASDAAVKAEAYLQGTPVYRHGQIENELVAILVRQDATADGKMIACRLLQQIGTDKSVAALAGLLDDHVLSHYARLALERMTESTKASDALIAALDRAPEKVRPGIIMSLGERGDARAVRAIARQLSSDHHDTAAAAMRSLAVIGGEDAARRLAGARVGDTLASIRQEALIACAQSLSRARAAAICLGIHRSDCSDTLRVAALQGLILADERAAASIILDLLKGESPYLRDGALMLVGKGPGPVLARAVADALSGMPAELQVDVLTPLGQRGDRSALKQVLSLVHSGAQGVKLAAIRAVGHLGDASCVKELLGQVKSRDRTVSKQAADSLSRIVGDNVDGTLIGLMADKTFGGPAMVALAERGCISATPELIRFVKDGGARGQSEAWTALAKLASEDDVDTLMKLVVAMEDMRLQSHALRSVKDLCSNALDKQKCFEAASQYHGTANKATKLVILDLAAMAGGPRALELTEAELKAEDKEMRDAALRTLTRWRDTGAAPALMRIAGSAVEERDRVLALRGCFQMARARGRRDNEKMEIYEPAIAVARRPDEHKQIISGLRSVRSLKALNLLKQYLTNDAVRAEAEIATVDLAWDVRRKDRKQVAAIARYVMETSKNKTVVEKARKVFNATTDAR